MYDMYSEFDVQKHKETYTNYLEVVIESDGHVLYAIPSHQEKMIELACKKNGLTRKQLNALCPQEYYGDFVTWLSIQSGAISVWNGFYMGEANEAQIEKLQELKREGIYTGDVYKIKVSYERRVGNGIMED